MQSYRLSAPDALAALTTPGWEWVQDLSTAAGVQVGTVVFGGQAGQPVTAIVRLPPGHEVPRHAHDTFRLEVILDGQLRADDGTTYEPGDVQISEPGELYGPFRVGPNGALTLEFLASTTGLLPQLAGHVPPEVEELLAEVKRHLAETSDG